ncbi:MAG: hypothetical protein ACK5HT_01550 [Draconibacterium sp.]
MEKLRTIPQSTINKIRRNPKNSGLAYLEYGRYSEINEYSDREITEMIYGIYQSQRILLTDGDYFLNLNDVVKTTCKLEDVTYIQKPTKEDLKTNAHNSIRNIRTFYVSDYYLVTENKVAGNTEHKITTFLYKIGAINKGRNQFSNLFSCRNHYQTLQEFKAGLFPKDLYHPIKRYINGLFFNDDYRIGEFEVKSNFIIELP